MKDNKKFIWRSTLNPVFSENEIEECYKETSDTINQVNGSYGIIKQKIFDTAKKHHIEGGTKDTFELNNEQLKLIFWRACLDKYGEEQKQFINEMIEANIAVLNGANIVETRKIVDNKKPFKHRWTDFDPTRTEEKNIDYPLLQKYKSSVEYFCSILKRDWDWHLKNDNWIYKPFFTDPKDEEWTDEGWRKSRDKDSETKQKYESFASKIQFSLIGILTIVGFFAGSWFGSFVGLVSGLIITNIQNQKRNFQILD